MNAGAIWKKILGFSLCLGLGLAWAMGAFFPAPVGAQAVAPQLQQPSLVESVERGYLAHRRGDYDQAIEIYTGIIRRRGLSVKERAVSYLLRGEAKRDKGDLEEAVYDFTRALNQWPDYPQAIFFRGQVLAKLDRLNEAFADLAKAVELDPDRESYQTNLALLKKRMQTDGLTPNENPEQVQITPPLE
ncbi:MAG: tetratricopeptide repeat protein [Deltaproteobacteria bacterium]|jgi:tetratricopeptide (TPR) repeat protein|nr:tetratricopeptide repeat protein [Deltaproteobacteria bacterium]